LLPPGHLVRDGRRQFQARVLAVHRQAGGLEQVQVVVHVGAQRAEGNVRGVGPAFHRAPAIADAARRAGQPGQPGEDPVLVQHVDRVVAAQLAEDVAQPPCAGAEQDGVVEVDHPVQVRIAFEHRAERAAHEVVDLRIGQPPPELAHQRRGHHHVPERAYLPQQHLHPRTILLAGL
jgi:hypothetical protein